MILTDHPCHVDGSQRGIEGKIELGKVLCLAVSESGKLLSVAIAEIDLRTRAVVFYNILRAHLDVGGEIEDGLPFARMKHHQPLIALERFGISDGGIETAFIGIDIHLFKLPHVEIIGIDLSVIFSWSAFLYGRPTFVHIHQVGIATESADIMEVFPGQTVDKFEYCEVGICHDES